MKCLSTSPLALQSITATTLTLVVATSSTPRIQTCLYTYFKRPYTTYHGIKDLLGVTLSGYPWLTAFWTPYNGDWRDIS